MDWAQTASKWDDKHSVLEIPTGPPVRGRQLWRRTGNFLLIFLWFYVYDLRFKTWGPTTFLTEFPTLQTFQFWDLVRLILENLRYSKPSPQTGGQAGWNKYILLSVGYKKILLTQWTWKVRMLTIFFFFFASRVAPAVTNATTVECVQAVVKQSDGQSRSISAW